MKFHTMIVLFLVGLLSGCASAHVSSNNRNPVSVPAGRIGLAPGAGVLGDAVGVELFQQGYDVVESTQVTQLVARVNLNEADLTTRKGLEQLNKEGIRTLLIVRSAGGYDSLPQSATVRIVNTGTGSTIGAVNWQNGYGGVAGSMADRVMRNDVVSAARQIVEELSKSLSK